MLSDLKKTWVTYSSCSVLNVEGTGEQRAQCDVFIQSRLTNHSGRDRLNPSLPGREPTCSLETPEWIPFALGCGASVIPLMLPRFNQKLFSHTDVAYFLTENVTYRMSIYKSLALRRNSSLMLHITLIGDMLSSKCPSS